MLPRGTGARCHIILQCSKHNRHRKRGMLQREDANSTIDCANSSRLLRQRRAPRPVFPSFLLRALNVSLSSSSSSLRNLVSLLSYRPAQNNLKQFHPLCGTSLHEKKLCSSCREEPPSLLILTEESLLSAAEPANSGEFLGQTPNSWRLHAFLAPSIKYSLSRN